VCRVVVKQQGNRPLRKPKCKWEDVIMDLKYDGREAWTGFIWLRIFT
jgi:hypothetical protein